MTDLALQQHYGKLEHMYLAAPVNQLYNPTIDIQKGEATIVIPVSPDHFHSAGALHGSVYFKVLDDATFFAANSLVPDVFVLTASFNLYITRPVSQGQLLAKATVVNQTRRTLLVEGVAYDSSDHEVARGSGSFMLSTMPLTPEISYA